MHGLREIAARSGQRFDEDRGAEFPEMRQRIVALMPRGAMGAVTLMQEEVLAAERLDTGRFEDPAGEIFVGGQRRGGGVVLRIP